MMQDSQRQTLDPPYQHWYYGTCPGCGRGHYHPVYNRPGQVLMHVVYGLCCYCVDGWGPFR